MKLVAPVSLMLLPFPLLRFPSTGGRQGHRYLRAIIDSKAQFCWAFLLAERVECKNNGGSRPINLGNFSVEEPMVTRNPVNLPPPAAPIPPAQEQFNGAAKVLEHM